MKKVNYLLLALLSLFLVGCGRAFDFKEYPNDLTITKKTHESANYSEFVIIGYHNNHSYYTMLTLVLPNNFGEVNYIVTVTNGIQAWPNK